MGEFTTTTSAVLQSSEQTDSSVTTATMHDTSASQTTTGTTVVLTIHARQLPIDRILHPQQEEGEARVVHHQYHPRVVGGGGTTRIDVSKITNSSRR